MTKAEWIMNTKQSKYWLLINYCQLYDRVSNGFLVQQSFRPELVQGPPLLPSYSPLN